METIEVIIAASIVFAVVVGFAFPAIIIETQYPANPAKWRSERRRRVESAKVRRISTLEHDLGYLPCSNDDCYSCKKIVGVSLIILEDREPPPPTVLPSTIKK